MKKKENGTLLKWGGLFVIMMAQIGASGDNNVVRISMSAWTNDLGASMDEIQLANIVYSLMAGSLMIVGGMLGLVLGWKRNFMLGALLCAAGSLVTSSAVDFTFITWGGRVLAGCGASMMIPSVLGIGAALYQGKDRAFAFGCVGASTGLAVFVMPLIAGWIFDHAGWRPAFIAMACYFGSTALLAGLIIPAIEKPKIRVRLDLLGTILAASGLLIFIIAVSKISVWGLITPFDPPFLVAGYSPALPMAGLGIAILGLLFFIEKKVEAKHGSCLVPASFTCTQQVRNGLYLTSLIFLGFGAAFFVAIAWMQLVAGYSATQTAVGFAFIGIPMMAVSMGIPKFFPDWSPYKVVVAGILSVSAAAVIMMMGLSVQGVTPWIYVSLAVFGAGEGMLTSQSVMIIAQAVNQRDAQQSGGIQTATRNVGQCVGVAVIGMVMLTSSTSFFKSEVRQLDLSPAALAHVQQTPVFGFIPNSAVAAQFEDKVTTSVELEAIVAVYEGTRLQAARISLVALLVINLLHLFGLGAVPRTSFHTKEANGVAEDDNLEQGELIAQS